MSTASAPLAPRASAPLATSTLGPLDALRALADFLRRATLVLASLCLNAAILFFWANVFLHLVIACVRIFFGSPGEMWVRATEKHVAEAVYGLVHAVAALVPFAGPVAEL